MVRIFHKRREYPIIRDRPSQISKENLIPVLINTLFRYYEDWKKQKHRIPRSLFKKIMMGSPDSTEKYVQMLADYYEVLPEVIAVRLQKPWGIEQLTRSELPDIKLARLQSEKEDRLEAALRLIYFAERLYRNPPEQTKRLLHEIVLIKDDTTLTISKLKGQIMIRKGKPPATS